MLSSLRRGPLPSFCANVLEAHGFPNLRFQKGPGTSEQLPGKGRWRRSARQEMTCFSEFVRFLAWRGPLKYHWTCVFSVDCPRLPNPQERAALQSKQNRLRHPKWTPPTPLDQTKAPRPVPWFRAAVCVPEGPQFLRPQGWTQPHCSPDWAGTPQVFGGICQKDRLKLSWTELSRHVPRMG